MLENDSYIMTCCRNDGASAFCRMGTHWVLGEGGDRFSCMCCPNIRSKCHVVPHREICKSYFICPNIDYGAQQGPQLKTYFQLRIYFFWMGGSSGGGCRNFYLIFFLVSMSWNGYRCAFLSCLQYFIIEIRLNKEMINRLQIPFKAS